MEVPIQCWFNRSQHASAQWSWFEKIAWRNFGRWPFVIKTDNSLSNYPSKWNLYARYFWICDTWRRPRIPLFPSNPAKASIYLTTASWRNQPFVPFLTLRRKRLPECHSTIIWCSDGPKGSFWDLDHIPIPQNDFVNWHRQNVPPNTPR